MSFATIFLSEKKTIIDLVERRDKMKVEKLKVIAVALLAGISLCGCKEDLEAEIEKSINTEGGAEGIANNAEELVTQITDGIGITDSESYAIDENDNTATGAGDKKYGLNEPVIFEMENGGEISITFTACDDKDDVAYISYVIENVGDTPVTVGEDMFAVYANDYKADMGYGASTVSSETISSGRKVSGKLYPEILLDKVKTLEVECGDAIFLLRDTTKVDAMMGTYYRIFEKDGKAVVSDITIYRNSNNNGGLAITAQYHENFEEGSYYNDTFSSWTFEIYDDRVEFTSSLEYVDGIAVYYSANPNVDGIYAKQICIETTNDIYTGSYQWTDNIQAIYDSVAQQNENAPEDLSNVIIDGKTYWWQEGQYEDAHGAEVTIGYDSNGELRIVGESWWSLDVVQLNAVVTTVNEDGSMIIDRQDQGILYVYPTEDGGIRIEQKGASEGLTFDGTYYLGS